MEKEKLEFEKVYMVYNSLFEAYHNEEEVETAGEDWEVSPMFHSLWTIFLNSVSWEEDEFWEAMEVYHEGEDCSCGAEHDEDDKNLNDLDISAFNTGVKDPKKVLH